MNFQNPIIPNNPTFIGEKKTLNYKAICFFAATGFFLDQDTFFNELTVLKPAINYEIDEDFSKIISEKPYFNWNYNPKERPLKQIVSEFATLFETIIKEQVANKTVILPLSGGLDSRTQAAALYHLGNKVNAYGYSFLNGHDETYYGKKVANACNFSFQDWQVPKGYLWNCIDDLAKINSCYSEFTHPRQMAFVNQYAQLGDVFSLGHWGDVLFDDMMVNENLSNDDKVQVILKKIIKKGGLELAESLWKSWQMEGSFIEYCSQRIEKLLSQINISNTNAQIRAFKSLYWAPRWTSTNLAIFESVCPISVPYYDNRMCEFICSVPEKYLSGRQIQIEYLKMRMPKLAQIPWQDNYPFNLYNYKWNKAPFNLPFKIYNKLITATSSKKYIQRNWELQFLGNNNKKHLEQYLFENESFKSLVSDDVTNLFYSKFKNQDEVYFSHSVSMLLTLSLFTKINKNQFS